MIQKNKIKQGYTLIEMIIVLGIVCIVMIMIYKPAKYSYQIYEERQFFRNFEQSWTRCAIRSIQEEKGAQIRFYNNCVTFWENDHKNLKDTARLKYPKTLSAPVVEQININPNGSISPKTIRLVSKLQKDYFFKFQMGYGAKYHVEEK